jgi:hypothetical protein
MYVALMMSGREKSVTAEPLVPEPSDFEVQTTIEKLKAYKSSIDQVRAELIQTGRNTLHPAVRTLINSWNKEELTQQWKESIPVPIYKK